MCIRDSFYAWEQPRLFFSVDIYTCRAFDPAEAVRFTAEFFGVVDDDAIEYREF